MITQDHRELMCAYLEAYNVHMEMLDKFRAALKEITQAACRPEDAHYNNASHTKYPGFDRLAERIGVKGPYLAVARHKPERVGDKFLVPVAEYLLAEDLEPEAPREDAVPDPSAPVFMDETPDAEMPPELQ